MANTTADKLALAAANKTAIKAAIAAKNPTTSPTDVMSQWPTAIASIPTGSDMSLIKSSVAKMTGESQASKTEAQLASAIKQITRKYDRRGSSSSSTSSSSPVTINEDCTAFRIVITHHEVDFAIRGCARASGHSSFTVDWGDGSAVETVSRDVNNSTSLYHSYAENGTYIIKISNDLSTFDFAFGSTESDDNFYYDLRHLYSRLAVTDALKYGSIITSLKYAPHTHSGCWAYCSNLITTVSPPSGIVNLSNFALNCTALTTLPDLSALTACTNMQSAFNGCIFMFGTISEWPPLVTNVRECYYGCNSLTGVWPGATDATLMPARVTNYASCVGRTSTAVRQNFLASWGGTRAS